MVMEVVHEDAGDGNMQCTNHPYKNSTAGGICAFCLQEKLGKLVSSSYPVAVFPSTSSSPSPSFRSAAAACGGGGGGGGATLQLRHLASQSGGSDCNYHGRKSRLPFVLTHRKKKKKDEAASIVFKRSKSTTTPRRGIHFMDDENYGNGEDCSFNRRGFWSFLYSSKQPTSKKSDRQLKDLNFTPSVNGNENVSPDDGGIDRKVSRSRSVGCGSRSFSGDFFERISTGFGDCTLRRVESQREGKGKMEKNGEDNCMKERVKCGGIFSGFMMASLSSSYLITSSSSSSEESNVNGKSLGHGRSKSWGWAFASPMRAFGKNSSLKRDSASSSNKKNTTPNLSAIPSLLAVSG